MRHPWPVASVSERTDFKDPIDFFVILRKSRLGRVEGGMLVRDDYPSLPQRRSYTQLSSTSRLNLTYKP